MHTSTLKLNGFLSELYILYYIQGKLCRNPSLIYTTCTLAQKDYAVIDSKFAPSYTLIELWVGDIN